MGCVMPWMLLERVVPFCSMQGVTGDVGSGLHHCVTGEELAITVWGCSHMHSTITKWLCCSVCACVCVCVAMGGTLRATGERDALKRIFMLLCSH